ncbi:MAG: hypothetical protein U9N49_09810 [Campylobacterota bacterium]|nr:hypothetical protein [Campylobacterota bacterium]
MNTKILSIATIIALTTAFNGCGSSTDDTSLNPNNDEKIDLAEYLPIANENRTMINIIKDSDYNTTNTTYSDEKIVRVNNSITYERDDNIYAKIEIEDDNITITYSPSMSTVLEHRYVAAGGIIPQEAQTHNARFKSLDGIVKESNITNECIFDKKLTKLPNNTEDSVYIADTVLNSSYEGDFMSQKCTQTRTDTFIYDDKSIADKVFIFTNISYSYAQKNKGVVAFMDKNCWVKDSDFNATNASFTLPELLNTQNVYRLDDTSESCDIVIINNELLTI